MDCCKKMLGDRKNFLRRLLGRSQRNVICPDCVWAKVGIKNPYASVATAQAGLSPKLSILRQQQPMPGLWQCYIKE